MLQRHNRIPRAPRAAARMSAPPVDVFLGTARVKATPDLPRAYASELCFSPAYPPHVLQIRSFCGWGGGHRAYDLEHPNPRRGGLDGDAMKAAQEIQERFGV